MTAKPEITGRKCLVMDVPEAGKIYLGLSRMASYAAAARGEIPTIRVGRLLKVPIAAMEQLLASATVKAKEPA